MNFMLLSAEFLKYYSFEYLGTFFWNEDELLRNTFIPLRFLFQALLDGSRTVSSLELSSLRILAHVLGQLSLLS